MRRRRHDSPRSRARESVTAELLYVLRETKRNAVRIRASRCHLPPSPAPSRRPLSPPLLSRPSPPPLLLLSAAGRPKERVSGTASSLDAAAARSGRSRCLGRHGIPARTQHGPWRPGAAGGQGHGAASRWVGPGWWRESGAATCSRSSSCSSTISSSSTTTSPGQHAGYGLEWQAPRACRLALVHPETHCLQMVLCDTLQNQPGLCGIVCPCIEVSSNQIKEAL
ncbi:hypothetical protein C2845_PM16G07360 [Panicum miliaceum]|uniref:Uncharacterized protein n=1 Tax=Panicum miliaceum TaxID=4540 RepID=A0A3L6PVJ9_PANMI|nr:hypothetical protein C2845_PM16G07360 [Panicum miliaceum]